ncbi:hypothetical protein [Sphingobacterium sp. IITKGP-BTPF85]|uniref:hypothetical protein n=1 Tax=Sphingobacterium sp. IITKGP-BTPF85 TaxID=1338009 RepID=UPI000425C23A|nr:hypothetical protein [Sphingobacterium sp. IITKGP-BTPF85]KKX51047.1 hypothetical protein L950_0207290 [Sphingobacterium sp. IITKGP-BTPF85]
MQILTTFTFGRDIINSTFAQRMSNGFFYGNPKDLSKASIGNLDNYDFWQKEGDISRYPAANPYMGLYAWRAGQSMFMEPGWYIRIKNINLAYRFDKTKHAWMNRTGINSFRIYGTMDNVHMFQNFRGLMLNVLMGEDLTMEMVIHYHQNIHWVYNSNFNRYYYENTV